MPHGSDGPAVLRVGRSLLIGRARQLTILIEAVVQTGVELREHFTVKECSRTASASRASAAMPPAARW